MTIDNTIDLLGFPLVNICHRIWSGVPFPLHRLLLLVNLCELIEHVSKRLLLPLLLGFQAVLAYGDLVLGSLKQKDLDMCFNKKLLI